MKVVIDTNVVVSAALKDRDPENVILFVVEHPDFESAKDIKYYNHLGLAVQKAGLRCLVLKCL